jgi:hypothetical protein
MAVPGWAAHEDDTKSSALASQMSGGALASAIRTDRDDTECRERRHCASPHHSAVGEARGRLRARTIHDLCASGSLRSWRGGPAKPSTLGPGPTTTFTEAFGAAADLAARSLRLRQRPSESAHESCRRQTPRRRPASALASATRCGVRYDCFMTTRDRNHMTTTNRVEINPGVMRGPPRSRSSRPQGTVAAALIRARPCGFLATSRLVARGPTRASIAGWPGCHCSMMLSRST